MKISESMPAAWATLCLRVSEYNELFEPTLHLIDLDREEVFLSAVDLWIERHLVPFIAEVDTAKPDPKNRTLMVEKIIDNLNVIRFNLQDEKLLG